MTILVVFHFICLCVLCADIVFGISKFLTEDRKGTLFDFSYSLATLIVKTYLSYYILHNTFLSVGIIK